MKIAHALLFLTVALMAPSHAQVTSESDNRPVELREQQSTAGTIEGYWQDAARRVLFMRDAGASSVYGADAVSTTRCSFQDK